MGSRSCVVTRGSHHVLPALLSPPAASPDQDRGPRHVESSLSLTQTFPASLSPGLASQDTNRSSRGLRDTQTVLQLQLQQEFKFLHREHSEVLQQTSNPCEAACGPNCQASSKQTQTCSQD